MGNKGSSSVRSCAVHFHNDTEYTLYRYGCSLTHGIWTDSPPKEIKPHETVKWMSESNGIMTGTEGDVYYTITKEDRLKLWWNNPYAGGNKYGYDAPNRFKVSYTGGSGDNSNVHFKINENIQTEEILITDNKTGDKNINQSDNKNIQREKILITAGSIDDIQVTQSIANRILAIIFQIEQLFGSNDNDQNDIPKYAQIIRDRIKHFNGIKIGLQNQYENGQYKYKNVGEILKDIDAVWKVMYQLNDDQTKPNKQHDPNSDFITFASGLEAEFYSLWDVFEEEMVKQGYLKKNDDKNENNDNRKKSKNTEELQELKDWFTNTLKLPEYYDLFIENGYDDLTFILGVITEIDLEEMGINKKGHKRKILLMADSPDNKKKDEQPPKQKTYNDNSSESRQIRQQRGLQEKNDQQSPTKWRNEMRKRKRSEIESKQDENNKSPSNKRPRYK